MKPVFVCALAMIALAGCTQQASDQSAVAEQDPPVSVAAPDQALAAGPSKLRLGIEGMHCDGCAAGVDKRLKGVNGVTDCTVSFETGEAVVVYDPQATDAAALAAAAVEGTNYSVSPLP